MSFQDRLTQPAQADVLVPAGQVAHTAQEVEAAAQKIGLSSPLKIRKTHV